MVIYNAWQCLQLVNVCVAFWLLCQFGRQLGLTTVGAVTVATVLLVVNVPLGDTFRCKQVNLWALNSMLFPMVCYRKRPLTSGLILALGAQIKIYPLVILGVMAMARRWRVVAGAVLGFLVLTPLQAAIACDWDVVTQYLVSAQNIHSRTAIFRTSAETSVQSVIRAASLLLSRAAPHLDHEHVRRWLTVLVSVSAIAVFGIRVIRREWIRILRIRSQNTGRDGELLLAHVMDGLLLAILVSPVVWRHHYVILIPLAVFLLATYRLSLPVAAYAGLAFIFIFPMGSWSFLPLVGLLLVARAVPVRPREPREPTASSPIHRLFFDDLLQSP